MNELIERIYPVLLILMIVTPIVVLLIEIIKSKIGKKMFEKEFGEELRKNNFLTTEAETLRWALVASIEKKWGEKVIEELTLSLRFIESLNSKYPYSVALEDLKQQAREFEIKTGEEGMVEKLTKYAELWSIHAYDADSHRLCQ